MDLSSLEPFYELTKQILCASKILEPYKATITDHSIINTSDIVEILHIDLELLELCQYPVFDLRFIEPLVIYIKKVTLPCVYVRDDFPIVSHLMISTDGDRKYICYTELDYEEVKHKINGRFLLDCINHWFIKTARNELHRDDQPIEPFFWQTNDMILFNDSAIPTDHIVFLDKMYNTQHYMLRQCNENNGKPYVLIRLSLPISADNIIRNPPKTIKSLLSNFSSDVCTQFIDELCGILRFYYNNIIKTIKIVDCNCIINLNIPQKRSVSNRIERYDYRTFLTENKTFRALLTDFGFQLDTAKNKPKRFVKRGKNNFGANINLLQLQPIFTFDKNYAMLINNLKPDMGNINCVLIGAGALGSQMFSNCIRAGFGNWTIIDKDVFLPHNIARHRLSINDIGKSKSKALAGFGKSIINDSVIKSIDKNVLGFSEDNDSKYLYEADLIIDISTSIAVEKFLALDVKSKSRRISLFLNSTATYLVMLCEDTDRKITLDELEMQLYCILSSEEIYKEYFNNHSTVTYSTSCRDISNRISQDALAMSAAIASHEIKMRIAKECSEIVIWAIDDDGIHAKRYLGNEWMILNCGKWDVRIQKSLFMDFFTKRKSNSPNETGGVMLGQYDYSRNILYIADMIFSPDDSIESPNSYIRGCEGLSEELINVEKLSYDNLRYIGEWHSHPSKSTSMSSDDENLLQEINKTMK
jgi:hypothetical protein